MRLDIPDPTTPEAWCASRCQDVAPTRHGPVHCEEKVTRQCDACGMRVCAVHWRYDDFSADSSELCETCWWPRWNERWALKPAPPEPPPKPAKSRIARWLGLVADDGPDRR